jgi:hypothetical protein
MDLTNYKIVHEVDKLRYGSYIRWFNKLNEKLYKGMIVCDIVIGDEGINIKGKTFTNQFLTIKIDDCIIFQKMTKEEIIIQKIKNTI